jgi:hypothetical protein
MFMAGKRPAPRRHSAFEDFPLENGAPAPETPPEKAPRQVGGLFEKRGGEAHVLAQPEAPEVERIERLRPSQMIPDRFQPRRLLPTPLRPPFYTGQINCFQAAKQWLQLAKNDAGIQAEVDRLLAMGGSFTEHGQIKPITGLWIESAGSYVFQIETGERRFWAACLRHALEGGKEEPLLRVEVVSNPTRTRQVLENRHAEPPSAVGQACEIASLILSEQKIEPQSSVEDEFAFFRKVHERRMPAGLWDRLMPIMQLTRPRMEQLLAILRLPSPLLDLADRHRLPERVLREVLNAPPSQWETLLKASIASQLTADDVAVMASGLAQKPRSEAKGEKRIPAPKDPATVAIQSMIRFANAMQEMDEITQQATIDELSDEFVINGQSEALAGQLSELARLMVHKQQSRYRRR